MATTLIIPPSDIELADFSGGFMPDLQEAAVPPNGLLDVNNLLPDRETGTLETRKGYKRFSNLLLANFEARSIFAYNRYSGAETETGKTRLIVLLHKVPEPSPREVDDVQVWSVDVAAGTAARVDDNGSRIWNAWASNFWGETIDNIFYGGGELDPMFSYRPYFSDGSANTDPWDPDASMGQWASAAWATDTVYAVGDRRWDTVVVEKPSGGLKTKKYVFVCKSAHTSKSWNRPGSAIVTNEDGEEVATGIREPGVRKWERLGLFVPEWASGQTYKVGAKVSYLVSGNQSYPRGLATALVNKRSTFICRREHVSAAGNEPPGNAWEPARAPISTVAVYHGNRIFIRDGDAGTSRLRYSAGIEADGLFDPTDWSSDDVQGAGYIDVRSGDGDDIKALASLNQNLIICKRHATWALTGYNPSTWAMRQIAKVGAVWKRAIVWHEGLVYFISDEGFMVTDGAEVREAPNANVIRDWLLANVQKESGTGRSFKVSMVSHAGYIWMAFPNDASVGNITLIYDPITGSFWKLTIPAWHYVTNTHDRVDSLFFAKVGTPAMIMQYAPATNTHQDDTGVTIQAFQDIPWFARTGWFTFGTFREQRRIRRTWAYIKGAAKNITLKLFRDHSATPAFNVTRTTSADLYNYVEGNAVRDIDPEAVSIEVAGNAAPSGVISLAIQTQLRRRGRWNRGARS